MKQIWISITFCLSIQTIQGALGWRDFKPDFHGKPCMNGTTPEGNLVLCPEEQTGLFCSPKGICECPITSQQFIYEKELHQCLPVSMEATDFRCQSDAQCQASTYGRYSKCNRDMDKCTCSHESDEVKLVQNVCFIVKTAKLSANFAECQEDRECRNSPLGNMTRCNLLERKCECYDVATGGKGEVGYYQGVCLYNRRLGEFCEKNEECRVGNHKNAICSNAESYLPAEKVCMCPDNLGVCDGESTPIGDSASKSTIQNILTVAITTGLLSLVANKIIM